MLDRTGAPPSRQARLLRRAFLLGAITDGLALVPMLVPFFAALLWGFGEPGGAYGFAMGYGASLMAGWTVLLAWAYRRPLERRFIAALTLLVIAGLVVTEIVAVAAGWVETWRMIGTWCLQAVLSVLFATAYHDVDVAEWIRRRAA